MSLAQFCRRDASRIRAPRSSTGASLLIRPGDRLALLAPERRRQVDGAPPARRRHAAGRGRRARARPRVSVAYLRQSQELSGAGTLLDALLEPFADLQRLHEQLIATEAELHARRPGDAGALRRDAGALPAPGRLRAGGAGQAPDDRRRLRRVGPRARRRHAVGRRARTAGAGEGAGAEARSAAARRADQPPRSGGDRTAGELPRRVHRARSCWCRTTARSSAPSAARSSSSRTASSSATRSATTSTSSSATRGSNARAPPTSARRSTSTRPRTSSAATWPARRPSRRRAGARCSRSWSGWSAPTTSGSTRARSRSSFQTGGDLGSKETIRAPKLTVGYPDAPPILRDVTANIYRGDKVGIVGPNGSGKSTLLKTLIGELPPLAGKVEIGTGVRIGYFDQKLGTLDEEPVADRRDPLGARRSVARGDPPVPGQVPLLRRRPVPHRARPVGRRAQPAGDGEDHAVPAQRAGARRADQPPRHPGARDAGGRARRLRRDADRRQPRSLLPRPRLHPPARHRRRPAGGAPRQLQRLAAPRPRSEADASRRAAAPAPKPAAKAAVRPPPRRATPTRTANASAGAWRAVWRHWRRM